MGAMGNEIIMGGLLNCNVCGLVNGDGCLVNFFPNFKMVEFV
jgi:hypothetical protein